MFLSHAIKNCAPSLLKCLLCYKIIAIYIEVFMRRDKNLPVTETTFYILLALLEPAHGYRIMQKVEELSDGHV